LSSRMARRIAWVRRALRLATRVGVGAAWPAAMVVGDVGPLRPCPNDGVTVCSGSLAGTPPPPLDNNANLEGVDPHGPDWAQWSPEGNATIAQWLSVKGQLPAVCAQHPCYTAGWTGP